jgi:hypothetical protein
MKISFVYKMIYLETSSKRTKVQFGFFCQYCLVEKGDGRGVGVWIHELSFVIKFFLPS